MMNLSALLTHYQRRAIVRDWAWSVCSDQAKALSVLAEAQYDYDTAAVAQAASFATADGKLWREVLKRRLAVSYLRTVVS